VPESPGFEAFAVDLLSPVGPVRARAMFGGHGIYCGEVMIGLVDDDELFLKTDEQTRDRFLEAGCRRWVYTGGGRAMETSYFRPPDEAHESPEEMEPWGRLALQGARRAATAKRAAAAKRARKKAPKAASARSTSKAAPARPDRPSRTARPAPRKRR
jgi:DNA transformation protein